MSAFTVMFRTSLDRVDVEDVHELSFLDNVIYSRTEDSDWREISSLGQQSLSKELDEVAGDFAYTYKLFSVSDGVAGKGRYCLVGLDADAVEHVIWDDVECVQGSKDGLFVYARRHGRGFSLEWQPDEAGWRFRDDKLLTPRPKLEGPLYVEIRLARYRHSSKSPRGRLSALAS